MSTVACPWCGRVNTAHDQIADPGITPQAGDVSVCWRCRLPAIFVSPAELRRPTADERADLERRPELRATYAAMAESYTPTEAVGLLRGDSR